MQLVDTGAALYGRHKYFDYLVYRLVMRNPKFRKLLQRLIYPTGTRHVTILGQRFLIDVQSEVGYYRASLVNNSNIYFRDEIPQLLSFVAALSPEMLVVDAGANIGTWAVQIASLSRILHGLKVLAFEPNPATFVRLRHNCSPFDNIEVYNLPLSDNEDILSFFETTTSGVFSVGPSHFNEGDTRKKIELKAERLDKFLDGKSNIALKIDVEGHELEVLRGAQRALDRGAIKVVFCDGIPEKSYDDFCGILERHGFELFNARTRQVGMGNDQHHPILAIARS